MNKNCLDIEFYFKAYVDLQKLSKNELIKHWIKYGFKENRLPSKKIFCEKYPNFNLDKYKYENINLNNHLVNDEQYYVHYHENILDVDFYKTLYKDLNHLNKFELKKHWNQHGCYENRSPNLIEHNLKTNSLDFKQDIKNQNLESNNSKSNNLENKNLENKNLENNNLENNKSNNLENNKSSNLESKNLENNNLENQNLENNNLENQNLENNKNSNLESNNENILDIKFYQDIYPDLSHLNENELKKHWILHGFYENRSPNLKEYNFKMENTNLENNNNIIAFDIKDNYLKELLGDEVYNKLVNLRKLIFKIDINLKKINKNNQNLKYNIYNYKIIDNVNIFKSNKVIDYYINNCLEPIKKKYNLNYKINNNVIPLLYYSEKIFGNNFLLENNNEENMNKEYEYAHYTLEVLIDEIKEMNWKYLIYSNDTLDIDEIFMIHNIFTIYKVKPNKNNYFIIENINNKSEIYITTHQKLLIENIYQKNPVVINYEIINSKKINKAYVLTICDKRYSNFINNTKQKNIDMEFIKFNGINKQDLKKMVKSNINYGHLACSLGHYLILKKHFDINNKENILVIEDDNDFCDNFNERWCKIKDYLDNNLNEWDLFLGNPSLTIYPNNLKIINGEKIINFTNTTKMNFIYYNKEIILKIINYYNIFYFDLFKLINNNDWIIDRFIRLFKTTTSIPFLTNEIPNLISTIDNKIQKYYYYKNLIEYDINKIINRI